MTTPASKRRWRVRDPALVTVVVATFTLALALRLWNVTADGPGAIDERETVAYWAAVEMVGGGSVDPELGGWPSGLAYLEWVPVTALHHLADQPLEHPRSVGSSPSLVPDDQTLYLLGGRVLIALLGALGAAVVALAARGFSEGLGVPLLAGLTAAVLPAWVDASQRLWPEAPAALGVALALLGALVIMRRGMSARWLVLAGAAVGLAAAFKYSAGLVVLAVIAAVALHRERPLIRRLGGLITVGVAAAVVFAVLSSGSLLSPGETWASLTAGPSVGGPIAGLLRLGRPPLIGPVAAGLAAIAVLTLGVPKLRRVQGRAAAVVAAPLAAWLVLIAWKGPSSSAYLAAVAAPAVALLVGVTAAAAARLGRGPVIVTVLHCAMGLALVPTALAGGTIAWSKGLPRTEAQALGWFAERVPQEARIATDWAGPPLEPAGFEVVAVPTVAYRGWRGLLSGPADYVVVTSATFGMAEREEASVGRFLDGLFEDRPAAAFCPDPGRVVGPEIWVFPMSDRARRTTSEWNPYGACRYDRAWMLQASERPSPALRR